MWQKALIEDVSQSDGKGINSVVMFVQGDSEKLF